MEKLSIFSLLFFASLAQAFIIQGLNSRNGTMKTYEELKIEVIAFDNEDVIVTSVYDETSETTALELPFVPASDVHG